MARKINLNITDFRDFRNGNYLYVDKTPFIEHLENDGNTVFLFCRPRRMGKTMNLTMLRYFYDMKEDAKGMFEGLHIENDLIFQKINKYPVIYLSFRDFGKDNYLATFVKIVNSELRRYLSIEQFSEDVKLTLSDPKTFGTGFLKDVTKNLFDVYNEKAIILIDEYDKPMMDNVGKPEFEDLRNFIKRVMSSALKDNPYLFRTKVCLE
ncbi:MAG: AAA family ATPase [Lachnospiraceae bacterium]|jgi:hypothetical protein|nr:AAA family ATPase [Lachnospiraceae bacterium]